MLKGISHLISPELLATLSTMGHGDEILLADAHFPGDTMGDYVIRADGLKIPDLLDGILPMFVLDKYVDDPAKMMAAAQNDTLDPAVESAYRAVIDKYYPETPAISRVERMAFYEYVQANVFAVVMTGDTAKYGNIIIKKGVTPV